MASSERKSKLVAYKNSIGGNLGENLTYKSFDRLLKRVYNYSVSKGYQELTVAHDSSNYAKKFLHLSVNFFSNLGYTVNFLGSSSPILLSSLVGESKKKNLGVYLTRGCRPEDSISLEFFNARGCPLDYKETKQIVRIKENVSIKEHNPSITEPVEFKFRRPIRNIKPTRAVHIDCMFGPGEEEFVEFRNTIDKNKIHLYNLSSGPYRINNYIPIPTDSTLRWLTTGPNIGSSDLYFAVGGDGRRLGVYDTKEQVEISPVGVTKLLLYRLKDSIKTAYLSKSLPKSCTKLAKKLGIKVVSSKNPIPEFSADELGRYSFLKSESDPLEAIQALIELSNAENTNFFELLGKLDKKYKIATNMGRMVLRRDVLFNATEKLQNKAVALSCSSSYVRLRSKDCAVKALAENDPLSEYLEFYIENKSNENIKVFINTVHSCCDTNQ